MLDPKHPLADLLRRDDRYRFDAYAFVFDALRYGQDKLGMGGAPADPDAVELDASDLGDLDDADLDEELRGLDEAIDALEAAEEADDDADRHVSGQELCRAIQQYAIDQYGMLARHVLAEWGVHRTGDFGEIVFNLIEIGQMRKTDRDRREDFDDVYDFGEAFDRRKVFTADHCAVDGGEDQSDG
ncbi:MAG: Minf_1886 family protein [Planctomycetota bacterium]